LRAKFGLSALVFDIDDSIRQGIAARKTIPAFASEIRARTKNFECISVCQLDRSSRSETVSRCLRDHHVFR